MDDAVSVAVVASRTEAELIAGMLRSHGVSAAVSADDAAGQYPQLQAEGFGCWSLPFDEASARRLLAAADDTPGRARRSDRSPGPDQGADQGRSSGRPAGPRRRPAPGTGRCHRATTGTPERLPHSQLDLVDAGHLTWEDAADQDAEIVTGW